MLIPLKRDFMFSSFFNQEKNIPKLERFISTYFDIDYEKVHNNLKLIPRKLPKNAKIEAYKEVDLVLELGNLEIKFNFEINQNPNEGLGKRDTIYAFKISSTNYIKGDSQYEHIWKTRQVNIDINHFIGKNFVNRFILKEEKTNEVYNDVIRIDVINVSMMDKVDYDSLDKSEKMAYNFCKMLLATSEEELKKVCDLLMSENESKDLVEQVMEMSSDEQNIEMESDYSLYERNMNFMSKEHRKELEQLKESNQKDLEQIVIKMLNDNINAENISKYVNLSLDEINKIKEKL